MSAASDFLQSAQQEARNLHPAFADALSAADPSTPVPVASARIFAAKSESGTIFPKAIEALLQSLSGAPTDTILGLLIGAQSELNGLPRVQEFYTYLVLLSLP